MKRVCIFALLVGCKKLHGFAMRCLPCFCVMYCTKNKYKAVDNSAERVACTFLLYYVDTLKDIIHSYDAHSSVFRSVIATSMQGMLRVPEFCVVCHNVFCEFFICVVEAMAGLSMHFLLQFKCLS
jgi:hypothetical protein